MSEVQASFEAKLQELLALGRANKPSYEGFVTVKSGDLSCRDSEFREDGDLRHFSNG